MKAKFRTPRKILSLFLCILMLATSVVIANPFTASAATAFNINSSGGDTFLFKYWFYYGDEDPDQGLWEPLEVTFDVSNDVTVLGANATNSKIVCISTEVEDRLASGPYYDGRCDVTSFPHERVEPGETFSGRTYFESALIYINTTRICDLYDQVTATYGSINSDEYSASSWGNYLTAYNVVKDYVTNGIHVTGTSVEDIDLQAKLTVACDNLESAIANLKHAEVSLRDVYKQVTGATLSGSDVIEIRKYFPVTVQLQEGYTNSNPQVRVLYNDGSYKDFTGTKSGNTVTYNIIINGTNVESIIPIGVAKNTYTVKIPTSKTGLSISGGGDKSVTHGGSVSFSVTKQTGYTQATPVVKVDGTQIGGVQNGDTYTYTISGITGNKTVTIDDMPINTYTVKVPTSATGLSITNGGDNTVNYNGSFSFEVTRGEAYTQRTPVVKVNDTVISPSATNGNTFTYTISGITENKTVTIDNLAINTYTVKVPTSATGLTITKGGDNTVNYNDSFTFEVTRGTAYTQSTPVVKVNGTAITGTQNGNLFTYTISGIKENKTVTIDNLPINTYTVTVPTSATGLTITKGGANTVTYGTDFSFTVTKKTGYTQATPVVKVDGEKIAGVLSGDTYTYTISNVTANKSVTVDGVAVNTYSVGYSLGAGVSAASDSASSIKHFGEATVKLTVDAAHSQNAPVPTVNNGKLSSATKNGTTYTYTLSGVTANTTVTVPALALNKYTVTVPTSATGLTITKGGANTVNYGTDFSFTVTKKTGYTQATPVVKVDGEKIAGVLSGNTYTYTISNITANKKVTFETQPVNSYDISYNLGEGTTADGSPAKIEYFDTKEIKITVGVAYTQSEPKPTVDNGSLTFKEQDGNTYVYTLSEPFGDEPKTITVTVPALAKNTYSAVLPYDKTAEASYKVTNAKADANNVVSGIVYGTDLTFGVALAEQYNRSTVVVKYNDSVLTPDEGGIYTIENITQDITEGDIVVEGVELNHYYITLPLETETGFVIEVGEGLNAKSVLSRTDFNFKFFLDPAYSDSTPTIKVSRDGGDHYSVLTKADGKYTIENVLSDCIVVVEGVKKNTYTVKFVDEGGNVLEEKKGVEYGSDVKYTGDTPTKATEKVSETTDAAGNTVLVERKYKFIGWSADTSYVTSNMEVTPIFEVTEVTTTTPADGGEGEVVVTKKTANILFISDEVIIHKDTVEKGESFSGWSEVPVKTSSNPYETYEFLGWDIDKDGKADYKAGESNAIADVQDDVTFVAVFKSNLPTQTVNFYNFDGSKLLYTASVKRGERATYGLSSIPSRTDIAYEYTFEGWSYDKYADETTVLDKIVVGENDITVYAAYSKEVIIYTYKYINDGVELQSGTYNFVDGKGTDYKYTGATPTRDSSKSTDYTFDGWLATTPSRYSTEYVATYTESVRNYDYALPETDGTYAIALDEAVGEKLPYGGELIFTITLDEGYTQTAPVVKSNGETLEYEKSGENSYVFTIVADGADADEIKAKLNDITVETAINHYDVAIGKADGADISSEGFNTEYNGEGTFTVTLKESHNQTAPVVAVSEGDRAVVTLVSKDGDVYTYKVSEIKSDATITVTTKINGYSVVMKNWDGKEVVFEGVLEHGQTPTYTNPTKPTDKFGGYTFAGWDINGDGVKDVDAIANVKNDINATAVYTCNHTHAEDPTAEGTAWVLASTDKATCTENGTRHYKCSYPGCTETKDWTIEKRGHKYGEYTVTLAATCTKDGSKIRYCVNGETDDYAKCNHSETAVVPKLGHAYGEWKTIVAPTCTEKGKAERVCANDPSHKEYKDVPATGHHDSDEDYICDDCGADLGHCSKCICHKGNILSKVLRYICTLLTKTFHKPIKCCKDMDWYGDKISSIS